MDYQQNAKSYPPLGEIGAAAVKPRETLLNKLVETGATLSQCEKLAYEISLKLRGPVPENVSTQSAPSPESLAAFSMDNHSRAIRIRDALEQINGDLA